MQAPDSAIGRKVLCPICQEVFTATLPRATVLEIEPAADLEPPPPGFADYPTLHPVPPAPPAPGRPATARPGDLIARPVDEEPPPKPPRTPAPVEEDETSVPIEIVNILQQEDDDDSGSPVSEAVAALRGGLAPADDDDGDEAADLDVQQADDEPSEAMADLAGAAEGLAREQAAPRTPVNRANQWYVVDQAAEYGPYTGQGILAAVRAGRLDPQVLLHDGTGEVELTVGQLCRAMRKQGLLSTPPVPGGRGRPAPQPAADQPIVVPPDFEPPDPIFEPLADPLAETHSLPPRRQPEADLESDSDSAPPDSAGVDAIDALSRMLGASPSPASSPDTGSTPPSQSAPQPTPSVPQPSKAPSAACPEPVEGVEGPAGGLPSPSAGDSQPQPQPKPPLASQSSVSLHAIGAASLPLRGRPHRGIGISAVALALTAAALLPVALGLLLPWLAPRLADKLPAPANANRLSVLAKPWALTLAGLALAALGLTVTLLGARRRAGRRLLLACLLLLPLACLVVVGLALHHIKGAYSVALTVASLGPGAWCSAIASVAAILTSALALAFTPAARRPRG